MTTQAASSLFINRELSWLAFNERVLEEAADSRTPLLERVKFVAIASSNLDEFFMIRVAGLEQALAEADTAVDLSGLTPALQLEAVGQRSHEFVVALYDLTTDDLLPALAERKIRLVPFEGLGDPAALRAFFRESVLPSRVSQGSPGPSKIACTTACSTRACMKASSSLHHGYRTTRSTRS